MIGLSLIFFAHSLWCLNLYDNKLSKRLSEGIYFSIDIVVTFLCICFCLIYDGNNNQKITVLFFVAFVIVSTTFFLLSKGYFFKKLFLIFTYYIFFCITHNLSYLIASCFATPAETPYYLIGISIRSILHIGALIPYVFWVKERILKVRVYDKNNGFLCVQLVSCFFACIVSGWLSAPMYGITIRMMLLFFYCY